MKKFSQMVKKATVTDNDYVPIVDTAENNVVNQNKAALFSTVTDYIKDKLRLASGVPVRVSSGNIDNMTTPGLYYLVLNTVSGLPEGGNGDLWVIDAQGDGTRFLQIFRRSGTAGTNDQNIYIRGSNAEGGWGTWWKYGDSTQSVAKSGDTMTGNLEVPSLYFTNGTRLYDSLSSTNGSSYILTPGDLTTQAQFCFVTDGRIGGRTRTRDSTSAQWSGWGSWKYLFNNNVSVSGVPCVSYVTTNGTYLSFLLPYAGYGGGSQFEITKISLVARHVDGGYIFARSGTNGTTYTQLGSAATDVWENGQPTRSGEITGVASYLRTGCGIQIGMTFGYALCTDNSGTLVKNNSPVVIVVTMTGTVT